MTFMEKLSVSGQAMLIGLFVVFFALALLIGCIKVMSLVMQERKKKAQQEIAPAAPAAETAPAAAPVVEEGISPEIVAIISAAIAAYDGKSAKNLVVRSIRRKNGWNRAAREDSICRF